MHNKAHFQQFCTFFFLSWLAGQLSLYAQEPNLPPEVESALQSNAQVLTPLTVDWVLQRHSRRTIEELLTDLGSKRYDFYRPETGTCSMDGVKFFFRETVERTTGDGDATKLKFNKQEYTRAWDGEAYFTSNDDGIKFINVSLPDSMTSRKASPEAVIRLGFEMQIGEGASSSILYHLQHGGKLMAVSEEELAGARQMIVTLVPEPWTYPYWKDRQYKYYLDPQKQYAVTQIDWTLPTGRLLCRIKNSQWKELSSPQIWLPTKSSCEWYTWHFCPERSFDDVFFYEDFSFELSRSEQPKTRFSPDLDEPGLQVSDPRDYAKAKPGALWNSKSKKWDYTNPPKFEAIRTAKTSFLRWGLVGLLVLIGFLLVRDRFGRSK